MSNDTTSTSKRPTHSAYVVREYQKDGKTESEWTRVGVAWQHGQGDGSTIQILDGISVSGRIVVRKNKPKEAQA
jgi:hypothetical protein